MDFLKICNSRTTVEITHVDNRHQKNKKTQKEMFLRKLRRHQIFLNLHAISKTFCWDLRWVVYYRSKHFYDIFHFADSQALLFFVYFFLFVSSAICFVCILDHKTIRKIPRFSQKYNAHFILQCVLCMDQVCTLCLPRICFLDKKELHIQQKKAKAR